jgi:hypothetical protein
MVHGLDTLHEINERASDTGTSGFDQWAIVDVMGHQRFIGKVTEQVIAGAGFIRVDVPGEDGTVTFSKLLGTASIHSISIVSEEIARAMASRGKQSPLSAYDIERLKVPQPRLATRDSDQEYDDLFGVKNSYDDEENGDDEP